MKEYEKLEEARYFYDRMIEVQKNEIKNNRKFFTYNFSAFLSASRSVLQYMCDEIKRKMEPTAKQEAKTWYEEKMVASPEPVARMPSPRQSEYAKLRAEERR
jgi:hypothetical protein